MTREEALDEMDRITAAGIAPRDSVTQEAKTKAAALFAVLYPEFERRDEIEANILMEHSETVIRIMSQAYQAFMNKEKKNDDE